MSITSYRSRCASRVLRYRPLIIIMWNGYYAMRNIKSMLAHVVVWHVKSGKSAITLLWAQSASRLRMIFVGFNRSMAWYIVHFPLLTEFSQFWFHNDFGAAGAAETVKKYIFLHFRFFFFFVAFHFFFLFYFMAEMTGISAKHKNA